MRGNDLAAHTAHNAQDDRRNPGLHPSAPAPLTRWRQTHCKIRDDGQDNHGRQNGAHNGSNHAQQPFYLPPTRIAALTAMAPGGAFRQRAGHIQIASSGDPVKLVHKFLFISVTITNPPPGKLLM